MSILGKLFGSTDVVKKTTEGIYNGIDKAVLTNEEKLDYNLLMMKAYEPFKIAQRLIAVTFCVPYAIAWLVTFVVSFFKDVATQLALLSGDIGEVVMIIVAFYFLGGVANGYQELKKRLQK